MGRVLNVVETAPDSNAFYDRTTLKAGHPLTDVRIVGFADLQFSLAHPDGRISEADGINLVPVKDNAAANPNEDVGRQLLANAGQRSLDGKSLFSREKIRVVAVRLDVKNLIELELRIRGPFTQEQMIGGCLWKICHVVV